MLTEILDRWEVLLELKQQQATWQQRWDRAHSAFEQSLATIDTRDAERLRKVLAESLPQSFVGPVTNPTPNNPPSTLSQTSKPSETFTESKNVTPPVGEPQVANVDVDCEAKAERPVASVPTPSVAVPADPVPKPAAEEEITLDDLLTWATEIVGDGVTENVLFQELRKSKYSSHARQLFDALKELDAFYETEDDVIRVQSLRALGL